ncbi:hypothetical protein BD289DRAFT_41754 [Coniella lustricola]|uniref:Uncharacterized protein n=1 Tax=Coniella lustricola TaxID=2025994 RepID=A0A2T3A1Z7_9PEZI|nr:hypothetical protein BD289DRAFT_41754 [Coniella lustricola]
MPVSVPSHQRALSTKTVIYTVLFGLDVISLSPLLFLWVVETYPFPHPPLRMTCGLFWFSFFLYLYHGSEQMPNSSGMGDTVN